MLNAKKVGFSIIFEITFFILEIIYLWWRHMYVKTLAVARKDGFWFIIGMGKEISLGMGYKESFKLTFYIKLYLNYI